jgi:hypothetical protein
MRRATTLLSRTMALDHVADRKNLAGVFDLFTRSHLRDVNQPSTPSTNSTTAP